ncbi:uncharacterized protein DDB_G0271670 [Amborella trichopoda]|nr:uncharacterized protein DDB_G0271670 [Amborella trichopoda]|eukprot:XP_006853713.2 uncharacterized protein DDB_G0271670 [Amborella trichopoda]
MHLTGYGVKSFDSKKTSLPFSSHAWWIAGKGASADQVLEENSSDMDAPSLVKPPYNHGIMDDHEEDDDFLSDSFSSDASEGSALSLSSSSSSSDLTEDATSSSSSLQESSSSSDPLTDEPLYDMSDLMAQLPFKSGLSKHFVGKSQSFISLSNVRCLEDLAKPENPYRKKLKSCKSYGGGLDCHKSYSSKICTKTITKKTSRGSCGSLTTRRNSFLATRPSIPPQNHL